MKKLLFIISKSQYKIKHISLLDDLIFQGLIDSKFKPLLIDFEKKK